MRSCKSVSSLWRRRRRRRVTRHQTSTRITAALEWLAPVAQMAEAGGLNPLQHGFESHRGHCVGLLHSLRSLCLKARSARCDVRWGAAVFVESDETTLSENQLCSGGVSSAPPADRRRGSRLGARLLCRRSGTEKHVPSLLLGAARGAIRVFYRSRPVGCSATPFSRLETGTWPISPIEPTLAVLRRGTALEAESLRNLTAVSKLGRNGRRPAFT
jgi:hypothetical protein